LSNIILPISMFIINILIFQNCIGQRDNERGRKAATPQQNTPCRKYTIVQDEQKLKKRTRCKRLKCDVILWWSFVHTVPYQTTFTLSDILYQKKWAHKHNNTNIIIIVLLLFACYIKECGFTKGLLT
jgi:hypothetical protein